MNKLQDYPFTANDIPSPEPLRTAVAGTPLQSMVWQPRTGRVQLRFHNGADRESRLCFLKDLQSSVRDQILVEEMEAVMLKGAA